MLSNFFRIFNNRLDGF
ncbi:hypothetical protein EE612_023071 [Oryza sativa]|nr:hypothetical protein EE612_023071 [Oryza sativa]